VICLAPRALEDSVRPRRLAGVVGRPLNFIVRSHEKRRAPGFTSPMNKVPSAACLAILAFGPTMLRPEPTNLALPHKPACSHPAAVEGRFELKAPNLIVEVKDGTDPYALARILAQKHHFTVLAVFSHALRAFVIKDIDFAVIPRLQCERGVKLLSFDGVLVVS
jgi:hypothetical protein